MIGYIYKTTNLKNGKIYIGQTCQKPEDRWDYGCAYKKHNLHLYNAIKKYGWKEGFSHEIIETDILTIEEANEKLCNMAKEEAQNALNKVLYQASLAMKCGYSRSDN